jgi:hypothetical protein
MGGGDKGTPTSTSARIPNIYYNAPQRRRIERSPPLPVPDARRRLPSDTERPKDIFMGDDAWEEAMMALSDEERQRAMDDVMDEDEDEESFRRPPVRAKAVGAQANQKSLHRQPGSSFIPASSSQRNPPSSRSHADSATVRNLLLERRVATSTQPATTPNPVPRERTQTPQALDSSDRRSSTLSESVLDYRMASSYH